VDEDAVERIVEAYLEEHPPEGGIHVGPEPPTDGSGLWADTDEDLSVGEDAVPAPPKAEVGQYLRVTEVGADGKIVATDTVGTDTSFSVSGAPADALVTGNNIKNIGKTLNAIEKASRYMTTSEWALSIDSVGMTVTVPAGMLACANWCIPVAEQTVAIVQDDPTTLVVYDSSADAVRSVRCTDYTGKTMYVIAVITRDRYAEPNANYVQGSYMVDGVLVGGRETGDYIPTPSTAQVGQTIVVKEVDGNGKPVSWECADVASGVDAVAEEMRLYLDTTITEDVTGLSYVLDSGGLPKPERRLLILLDTAASSSDTNYMPVTIKTGGGSANQDGAIKFYPPALPRKTAARGMYEIERINEKDVAVSISSGDPTNENKGVVSATGYSFTKMYITPVTSYGIQLTDSFHSVHISTYGTFVAGTRFRIMGV
jgi:hypothetical protein